MCGLWDANHHGPTRRYQYSTVAYGYYSSALSTLRLDLLSFSSDTLLSQNQFINKSYYFLHAFFSSRARRGSDTSADLFLTIPDDSSQFGTLDEITCLGILVDNEVSIGAKKIATVYLINVLKDSSSWFSAWWTIFTSRKLSGCSR